MRRDGTTTEAAQDAALSRLRLRAAAGARPDRLDQLPAEVRPAVAVAESVGAALLPTIDAAVAAHDQRRAVAQQVRTATAPARTVAVGLVALPLVAVPVLARLLEIDLRAFYGTGVGAVVGMVALALWGAGAAMIAGLVARAGREPAPPAAGPRVVVAGLLGWLLLGAWGGVAAAVAARLTHRPAPAPDHPQLAEACDLAAAALSAGLTVPAALRGAADHLPGLADDLRRLAWQVELGRLAPDTVPPGVPTTCRSLAESLAIGLEAGGPLVPTLRALARQVRDRRGAVAEAAAGRLPARLTFPTALLLLPATVLAIGAPIVVTGLAAFSGA